MISAAGKSAKYPNGKAEVMRSAIEDGEVTPRDFSVSALQEHSLWILDKPNGSNVGLALSTVEKTVVDT